MSYQKDAVIRYRKNPDYYGEKALVDDLVYAITPDATARYAKLKAGECHVNGYPRPADLAEMQKDASLKVISMSGLNIAYWAFNAEKPPFDKKEAREALAMAIDRDAIVKDVYLGAAEKASTLIPRTMWAYNPDIAQVPYDPEKAKQMLAAAGVKTPLDIDLWYMPVSRPYNPNGKRIGEMMQADLAGIGVNAKLQTYEWGEYRKRVADGDPITAQYGWTGDNGDPDNFFFLRGCPGGKPGPSNPAKWCNKEFDDLLVEGAHHLRSGRARQALQAHAGDRARRGAGAPARALHRLRGDARQCRGLQTKPARHAYFRGRRAEVRSRRDNAAR